MEPGELDAVVRGFGLGEPLDVTFLPHGLMNDNWRVRTATAAYAVKRIRDIDVDRVRRQHHAVAELADRGLPVPRPLQAGDGSTLVAYAGSRYAAVDWIDGDHLPGTRLDPGQCRALGRLLGELQLGLAGVLAEPPRPEEPVTSPDAARAEVERHLALVTGRPAPDDFDRQALTCLARRLVLLDRRAELRPRDTTPLGPIGWTHGDFQQFNLLWSGGAVVAVLDWDRLRAAPLAWEVVRAGVLVFTDTETAALDLARVSEFVAGYHGVVPLSERELTDAVRRWWWEDLCGLWPLARHYEGDRSADHLFLANARLLDWWADHHEAVCAAFVAGRG